MIISQGPALCVCVSVQSAGCVGERHESKDESPGQELTLCTVSHLTEQASVHNVGTNSVSYTITQREY